MPDTLADELLEEMAPPRALRLLGFLRTPIANSALRGSRPQVREDLELMMSFPPNTAGTLMDTGVAAYREKMSRQSIGTAQAAAT